MHAECDTFLRVRCSATSLERPARLAAPRPTLSARAATSSRASGGRGYQPGGNPSGLVRARDRSSPGTPRSAGPSTTRRELVSTNDRAHRLAELGARHGEVVVAERQTEGRGPARPPARAPRPANRALGVLRPSISAARRPPSDPWPAVGGLLRGLRGSWAPPPRASLAPTTVDAGAASWAGLLTEMRARRRARQTRRARGGLNCGLCSPGLSPTSW